MLSSKEQCAQTVLHQRNACEHETRAYLVLYQDIFEAFESLECPLYQVKCR